MLRSTVIAGLLLATVIGEGAAAPAVADRSTAVATDGGLVQLVKSRHRHKAVVPQPVMGTTGPVTGMGGVPPPPLPPALGKPPGGAPESFGDRAVRCIHHGGSFGVPQSQMGVYTHNCAFGN
jgi:hypothetical protein